MTRTEMIVELEDIKRRVGAALDALRAEQRREDEVFRKIMDAVRENDEWAAGGPVCGASPVGSADQLPAKGFECSTHAFAAIQQSGGCCAEAMDALDDEAAQ